MYVFSKFLGIVFTIFFIYAAIVQFNDVDALIWVALYAIAAAISVLFTIGKLRNSWCLVLFVVYLGLAIYYWPAEFEGVALGDSMKTTNVELGRESLGMGVSAAIMLIYFFLLGRRAKP